MMKIIFRADGNASIGLGHVIRSLALAEMLREDFECVFAIQNPIPSLREQIKLNCDEVIDLPSCTDDNDRFFHELDDYIKGDEIVVLDGYRFDTMYQKNIKQKGCSLVCIDDIHAYHFVADIVVNHAVGFDHCAYSGEAYTNFLFGPKYALLRKSFLQAAKIRSSNVLEKEILVSLGGADPTNETLNVVKKLNSDDLYRNYKVNIVVGAAYSYQDKLFSYLETNCGIDAIVHRSINARQMVELMRRAEMSVCAPSSVTFEYLSVSEGKLSLVYLADNQREFYNYLTYRRIAFDFFSGCEKDLDHTAIAEIKKLLDGNSDINYKQVFNELQKEICRLN